MKGVLQDFVRLFYPTLCACCSEVPPIRAHRFCTHCLLELPYTDHFEHLDNPMSKKFWGRVNVAHAVSLLYFDKGGKIQDMIHNLKYHGRKVTGTALGELAGRKILEHLPQGTYDVIIPVPIHRSKLVKRGYNQSEAFARGISDITGIPVATDILLKTSKTKTQTGMGRQERFENVSHTFGVNTQAKSYKHYLVVDDVLTTGATLEACVHKLNDAFPAQYSVMSMVMARS